MIQVSGPSHIAGKDVMEGGAGNDRLVADIHTQDLGRGPFTPRSLDGNTMTGGFGADRFEFSDEVGLTNIHFGGGPDTVPHRHGFLPRPGRQAGDRSWSERRSGGVRRRDAGLRGRRVPASTGTTATPSCSTPFSTPSSAEVSCTKPGSPSSWPTTTGRSARATCSSPDQRSTTRRSSGWWSG